jgi:hypothetical protein
VQFFVAVNADKFSFGVYGQVHSLKGDSAEQYFGGVGQYKGVAGETAVFPSDFQRTRHREFPFLAVGEVRLAEAFITQPEFLAGFVVDNECPRACINNRLNCHLPDFILFDIPFFGKCRVILVFKG